MQSGLKTAGAALVALSVLLTPATLGARRATDEVERVKDAIEILRDLTETPDDGIPHYLLERAEAIVVVPNMIRGGFILGAKHGRGIVSARDRVSGMWSPPAFVAMTGGSVGWQIGAQSVDLVLLVMNQNGVRRLLDNQFTLGGEVSVAAGPVGRTANAATDPSLESQILAYSRAKGLFAGATLEGVALRADDDANEEFYERELDLREIAIDRAPDSRAPIIAAQWTDTLRVLGTPRPDAGDRRPDRGTGASPDSRDGGLPPDVRDGGRSQVARPVPMPPPSFSGQLATVDEIVEDADDFRGKQVMVTADVEDVFSRTVFSIDQDKLLTTGRDILVVAPNLRRPVSGDMDVTIVGDVMEFDKGDVEDRFQDYDLELNDQLVRRFDNRPVIIPTSIRTRDGEELLAPVIRR